MTATVALLHGFTGSPNSLHDIARALAAGGDTVLAPALVGHAGMDDPRVDSFETEVDRLADELHLSGPGIHLVGYSLGGRLAIGLLCRHPELFAGATLISAQPGLPSDAERAERRRADERWCEMLEQQGIAAFVRAWEALPLFATQTSLPADVQEAQRAERLSQTPAGLARSLRLSGLGNMPSYWDDLPRVTIPTSLVVGEKDPKFVAIAERMQERLPRATLTVVADAGHNVVLEKPREVLAVISTALEQPA
jgi:2-succinyl-6-hydroxy-2,4-cyclohexadiene-1-carboxylate synthase